MRRLLWLLLPLCLVLVALSACTSDPIQEDLLTYVNEDLQSVSEMELEAIDSYDSVSGDNYTDDWTMYETIDSITIPAYEEFIAKLEDIKPKTEELRAIHNLYIEGSNAQMQGFKMILVAIDLQSHDKIFEANEKLDEGRTKIRQFQIELEDLMEEHEVEFEEEAKQ
ncbi:hypothetical protein FIU87_19845 [Bacillus sp. THAF10]|uniref:hypothetical protein n=1 Tax=Bacillus sp. THAF10 TaxID=2587848 RepID=UPI001269050B|nr:hypothetical protein [Bacillus sp. THAF10]QFT90903.1 hypothetical protein FIU87_19845 [Bacillus sp. THAF10]